MLTYNHVRAGLIRVTPTLPANVDVIDEGGQVITNAERTVFVRRAVPSIENTALTAPYLSDGRAATLEEQALGALHGHSAVTHDPPESKLDNIAAYERTLFSSPGVESVFTAVAAASIPTQPPSGGPVRRPRAPARVAHGHAKGAAPGVSPADLIAAPSRPHQASSAAPNRSSIPTHT